MTYTATPGELAEYSALAALEAARKRLKRVSRPDSIANARAEFTAANDDLYRALILQKEERYAELRQKDNEHLLKALRSARNYNYECQMGEYSIGSQRRALEHLNDVIAILAERDIDADQIEYKIG